MTATQYAHESAVPSMVQRHAPLGRDDKILVFDIGGTNIRAGLYDRRTQKLTGQVDQATPNFLTLQKAGADGLVAEVVRVAQSAASALLPNETPDAVVVGYPGPVTPAGIALRSPTILGPRLDRPIDVYRHFAGIWPEARIHIVNDVTCSGYYYVRRGYRDFCVISVGSGIGNKVFLGGVPQVGERRRGGEIGHIRVSPKPNTPVSDVCEELGNVASGRGCLELARLWASRCPVDFAQSALCRGENGFSSSDLVAAFRGGDTLTSAIIAAASYPLAAAIGTIHLALGVDRFVVLGGFSKALGERYRLLLVDAVRRATWDLDHDWSSMIELGAADSQEALLGAGFYAATHAGESNAVAY